MSVLDIIGLCLTFAIVIYIGVRASKKVKTSDDFLLAGRSLSKVQSALSLAATDLGGASLVGAVEYCYQVGIAGIWYCWATVPVYIFFGLFFIDKLYPLKLTTIPEFFQKRYDDKTRLLTSIMHLCAIIGGLATQFTVSSIALHIVLGIPIWVGLAISVIIVLIYTSASGLLGVVNTDVFQFFLIMTIVIIMIPLSINSASGMDNIMDVIPKDFKDLGSTGIWAPISWIIWGIFAYPTNQHYLQRVFASKDEKTAKFSYVFTGLNFFVLGLATTAIALAALVILPDLTDASAAYPLLLKELLPGGIRGIALGGIFAATMSSADSYIMAGTSIFVNDVYKPYFGKDDSSDEKVLKFSRILTIVQCAGALIIANFAENILDIVFIGGLFYSSAVFFPLMLGLFWRKGNKHGAFIGIITSLIVGLSVEFDVFGISTGIFALPANIVGSISGMLMYMIVSIVTKGPDPKKLEFLDRIKAEASN